MKRGTVLGVAATLVLALQPPGAHASPDLPEGTKTITLVGAGGERVAIGTVEFKKDNDARAFKIKLHGKLFQDEFLSMRPFKCMPGEKEMWCHLAYPYDLKKRITVDDLVDLEYSLLFLFKPPKGYGINPYNGLYFKMQLMKDGAITGAVHDIDLDPLGVPPADRSARTISADQLWPSDPETHRFSNVEIR